MWRFSSAVFLVLLPVYGLYVGDSCVVDSRPGMCVQLTNCQPLLELVQDGGTPMPMHIRRRLQAVSCGFKADQPLVCCAGTTQDMGENTNNGWNDPNRDNKPLTAHSDQINNPDRNEHFENSGTNWGVHSQETSNDCLPHTNQNGNDGNRGGEWTYTNPNSNDVSDNQINTTGEQDKGTSSSHDENSPPDVSQHRNLRKLPSNCGAVDEDRIWGGNRTGLFEMPWMVLIAYDSPRGTKLSCAGTLVTEQYVLTAAHCVSHLKSLHLSAAILGEHDVRLNPDCERIQGELQCAPPSRNVSIASVVYHPRYTPQNLVDDIALIRLSEPADFALDNMKPICLPISRELQIQDISGVQGVVAGWGVTEDGLQSPVLLKVDLPILTNEDCKRRYNDNPRIYDRQLCAGGVPDKDSCGGDSGGPLLYPGRTTSTGSVRYVQRGIVSFGSKRCGVGSYPGVYTRVGHYMDWILDNIND